MAPYARIDDGALLFTHQCVRGMKIDQRLPLGPEGWSIADTEPLTVAPSILCNACGTHGYIRDGVWVSA